MDKYQKVLLETDKTSVFFSCTSKKNCTLLDGGFDYENNIYIGECRKDEGCAHKNI